jgi:uncharacterized protein YbjT (DUF2867 family)
MGARGKVGQHVMAGLSHRGTGEVRCGTRDPSGVTARSSRTTTVRFDWCDEATWEVALKGVDGVHLLRPPTGMEGAPDAVRAFLTMVPSHARIVLLSEIDAGRRRVDSPERGIEAAIEDWESPWTILRPNWFLQNLLQGEFLRALRDERRIAMPFAGSAVSWIDARDIADVAIEAIDGGGALDRASLTLTGPRALTLAELADHISQVTGVPIVAENLPMEAVTRSLPAQSRAAAERVYATIADEGAAVVTEDVQRATGHAPRSVSSFVGEHSAAWD